MLFAADPCWRAPREAARRNGRSVDCTTSLDLTNRAPSSPQPQIAKMWAAKAGKELGKEIEAMLVLQVTAEQIRSIRSAELLVELLRRLLHADARAHGIARSGVSTPAQITVSDDGEDAKVEWRGGPVPACVSCFQSKATKMQPSDCAKQVLTKGGSLKLAIRDALEVGGAYVVFLIHIAPFTRSPCSMRLKAQ